MVTVSTFPNGTRGYSVFVDGQQVGTGRIDCGTGASVSRIKPLLGLQCF